jgi:FAD/FMN-containing dehydrogenase
VENSTSRRRALQEIWCHNRFVNQLTSTSLIQRLGDLLGSAGLITGPTEMSPYLSDERNLYQGIAACVARPVSTEELSQVVRICRDEKHAIVPQGGNTGYCGGASPDSENQVLVSLSRMNRVREIDPVGFTATVEAGVVLADLQTAVSEQGLFFPLSMGSEGSCQIGGNLSTNAGGLAVLHYGTAGELALGLEVVLPSGEILDCLTPLRKDNTGYDLKSLFLGAEGTLGIITAAVVKLFPAPTEYQTAWLSTPDTDSVCQLLALARKLSGDTVTSFEYISQPSLELVTEHIKGIHRPFTSPQEHQVLMELSGPLVVDSLRPTMEAVLVQALEQGLVTDAVLAESQAQRQQLWRIRESIPEAEKHAGRSIKHDVSVSIGRIPEYLAAAPGRLANIGDYRASIYGHVGDGNLHYNLLAPAGEDPEDFRREHAAAGSLALHQLAADMGGSFSAEHGIGKLKVNDLRLFKDPVALQLMCALKKSLDPDGLMNPGKLL